MKKAVFRRILKSLKDGFRGFSNDKVPKLSASLAFYTIFSLGPLLIVIIYICSLFLSEEAVQGGIYDQLRNFIGPAAAEQIQTVILNASVSDQGGMAAVIGIITLLIGATTVFGELQDSMNSIWGVRVKKDAGIMKLVMTRLLSFGLIASMGFLLLVSLAVTTLVEAIGNRLQAFFPAGAVVLVYLFNLVLTLVITLVLFAGIFRVLPDISIKWKYVMPGAIATALLFLGGKFLISLYLGKSEIGTTYGAAGSLVILLMWVYYSSMIVYYGAEFTRAYVVNSGVRIRPDKDAVLEDRPTVPGAAEKKPGRSPSESRRHIRPQPVTPAPGGKRGPRQKSGIGTLLAGLALYFYSTGSRKRE